MRIGSVSEHGLVACCMGAVLCLAWGQAAGDVVYLTQDRSITAITTANAGVVTRSAPGFGPFVEVVTSQTMFPAAGGGMLPNDSQTTIDCDIDPNAITILGGISGSGGVNLSGAVESGEGEALILVTFSITVPTPYRILASARPSTDPRDSFEINLENLGTGTDVYFLDDTSPPQGVDVLGVLQPGSYLFEYHVELTVEAAATARDFACALQLPAPGAALGVVGTLVLAARRRR